MICLTTKAKREIKAFSGNFMSFILIVFTALSITSAVTFTIILPVYFLGGTLQPESITIMFYAGIMAIPVFLLAIFIALEWLYHAFKKVLTTQLINNPKGE